MPFTHPFLAAPSPVPIAHKGGAGVWPENTMVAFAGAVDLGYEYLELDVQGTLDGRLAVFHDNDLAPVTNRQGRLSELTFDEVTRAKVSGVEPVCALEEVVASWPDAKLLIDPKTDVAVGPLMRLLARPGLVERVCIGSFSDRRLRWINQEFGDAVCLSMGPRQMARFRLATALNRHQQREFRANVASVPMRQYGVPLPTAALVERAHEMGIAVHVWTIDSSDAMHELVDRSVDGIITDRPHVLLEVLGERGAWPPSDPPTQ